MTPLLPLLETWRGFCDCPQDLYFLPGGRLLDLDLDVVAEEDLASERTWYFQENLISRMMENYHRRDGRFVDGWSEIGPEMRWLWWGPATRPSCGSGVLTQGGVSWLRPWWKSRRRPWRAICTRSSWPPSSADPVQDVHGLLGVKRLSWKRAKQSRGTLEWSGPGACTHRR